MVATIANMAQALPLLRMGRALPLDGPIACVEFTSASLLDVIASNEYLAKFDARFEFGPPICCAHHSQSPADLQQETSLKE